MSFDPMIPQANLALIIFIATWFLCERQIRLRAAQK